MRKCRTCNAILCQAYSGKKWTNLTEMGKMQSAIYKLVDSEENRKF